MQTKKILFLVPPNLTFGDYVSPSNANKQVNKGDGKLYGNLVTDMPLGVLALSSYLKKHIEVEIELVDFNIELDRLNEFKYHSYREYFYHFFGSKFGEVDQAKPEVIGISSLFSPSYAAMLDIAAVCKEKLPGTLILAGGNIPSNMYHQIFRDSDNIDAICFGEGEKPLLALIQSQKPLLTIKSSGSWITKSKIREGFSPSHDFIENLDEIPFYDYTLCGDKYFSNPTFPAYGGIQETDFAFQFMTSRGCPFKCIFCASHKVHGRKMRYYSINRVKADLLTLKNVYGAKTLIFQDDHFMGDKKRALEIVRFVAEMGVKVVFQNALTLYALDREMLEAIRGAGIRQLVLPIESGSDRVLKHVMHKPLKLSIVEQVVRDCRELGIYTYASILIGLPGETKADIEDSLQFLKTTYTNWFSIFCANPLVGSKMFDICVENGYLKDDWVGSDYKRAVVQTEDWTSEYIQEMSYILNLELNFVYNSDYRLGNYQTALDGFERAIRAKPDHAIAYYFAAQCYEKLGDNAKSSEYMNRARKYSGDPFWSKYIDQFKIPIAATMGDG